VSTIEIFNIDFAIPPEMDEFRVNGLLDIQARQLTPITNAIAGMLDSGE
jgi:hypothetical protein